MEETLEEKKSVKNISFDFSKYSIIPATAKIFLLQNLSVMLKAGISLADALNTLSEQVKNKKLKKILAKATNTIREGKTLSESFEPYSKDFGELFINMIKAGESSGRLEEVLNELYIQHKKDHTIVTKVRNAMIYPCIIIVAMLGISIFVLIFVLPTITGMFREMNTQLPITTRVLIFVSDFMQEYGLYILIVAVIILLILYKSSKTKKGKNFFDRLLLKTPIVSSIISKINLARASRSLCSLIKTDIAIVDTLNITSKVLGNSVFSQTFSETAEKIKKGQKLTSILKEYPKIFPGIFVQMVSVGEETGTLDNVLGNLADFYEEEVSQTMNNLPVIIEPILMLLIGAGVAGIAVAVFMPIFSMTENM